MEYSKEDIKVFKKVVKDYKSIKKLIDSKIKEDYSMEDLYDYLRHISGVYITNYELYNDPEVDNEYIDFEYGNFIATIIRDYNHIYLGETIDVYDKMDFIDTFNNTRELEDIIKESEGKQW